MATQTDDVVGSVTKNIDLTQPRSIFGPTSNLPSRRFNNYVRKFTTGNGQTKFSELDSLDSIPLTGDRNNIRNPIFKPDKNAAPRIVAANEVITEGATTLTVTPPSPTLAEWTPAAGIAGWGRRVVDGIVKYESGMFLPDYRPPGI
ncbi:TPA: hypothetical protein QEM85_001171 [Pseudomonas putida]|uniref:hypothetical protein n=1 Tax=Pseudomonas putida TaxID=303 RepID=UPI00110C92F3|nr:hypothetical protein [Pseudomonas putida]MDD1993692.1 hypothetical protein [Pseudomonas putida]HDS0917013.1 hypothetical protein [Pseudomonas putida]HDS0932654.1 hypothetical protein [Pseudomonas putida]HDS1782026.1 hypothetical protein [Pseudomonas putida]HDS3797836.1 hypothetical protein [Pseudomonas putida]